MEGGVFYLAKLRFSPSNFNVVILLAINCALNFVEIMYLFK